MPSSGIFLFDHDMRCLAVQGDGLPDVGLTPERLEGKTIWEALPPETCRSLEPRYRAALAGEASVTELPFAGRTYATNIIPVHDREGAVRCGLMLAQEVTRPDRIDDELYRNQARYRHLLESITGYTYTTTYFEERPAVTIHSPGVQTVTGYTTEDYSANPHLWLEMVEPADRPDVERHVAAALRGDLVPPLEHRIRQRSGELRWIRNTLVARRDATTGQLTADGLIEDVTERRRAQEATAEAKGFLQQVVDASPSLIFVVDPEGRVLFVNRYAADYHGSTPGASSVHPTGFVRPTSFDADAHAGDDAEVIRTRQRLVKEEQNSGPDGGTHWFHTIKVPFFQADGTVNVLGISTDITERKRAEVALQQSEARFRMLTAASFEGIGISEGGMVVDVNDQLLAILGYERSDFIGRRVTDLVAPESREQVAMHMRTSEDAYEHWMLRKDGRRVLMEARGRALDVAGRRLRVTALRDITDKKRAEQALRESEERFRTLAEESSDGIFLADPLGRYQDVNPAGSRMLGYSRDEVRTLVIADIVAPEEVARVGPEVLRLREDRVVRTEWRLRRKDGSVFDGEVDARLLSDGRILGVVRDITERRRTEAERREFERVLQDTQRLEALGTLAGGVAHDFNNILAAIFGHLALARMDLEGDHPVRAVLGDIAELSERARDLVRQILAFSRSPNDQRERIDLAEAVKEVVRMLRATIPTTVEIRAEFEPDLPRVLADASQIHRIIVNLCTNAWQALGARPGSISLGLGVEEVDAARAAEDPRLRQGRFVVLRVRDTGSGMDAETIPRIFEPFFTTKGARQGTGLGLAVVHGVVRAHAGFVTVRSTLGQGSEFRVYLPASRDSSPEIPPARPALREGRAGGRVLFLDDEPQVARACSRLLRRVGYEVATFQSPSEALADFQRDPAAYDIVITDMTMPEMDGLEFSRALRAVRPDVPIILATGYSALLTKNGADELGLQALIYKPLDPDEFIGIVQRVLEGVPALTR
jgi:PAS domain S-box-containing protein